MSFQAIVSESNQPPRNQAWFTLTLGSLTVAAKAASSCGASGLDPLESTKPPGIALTAGGLSAAVGLAVLRLPLTAMKFSAFQENTAWTSEADRLVKRYSSAATGRLAASALPGSKGLQPQISTSRGTSGSCNVTVAKGNFVRKRASRNRGSPNEVPEAPLPVPGCPNSFQPGTGPSSTRATGDDPVSEMAANVHGSLNTSGCVAQGEV